MGFHLFGHCNCQSKKTCSNLVNICYCVIEYNEKVIEKKKKEERIN